MPVPSILHQSWWTDTLPKPLEVFFDDWREELHQSEWTRFLWTDESNRALWVREFPEMIDVYDAYAYAVERADATRLLYMHVYGGVYADIDVVPCRDAIGQFRKLDVPMLVEDPSRTRVTRISNFVMASPRAHPFWRYAIEQLRTSRHNPNTISRTGPAFLNAAYLKYVARDAGIVRVSYREFAQLVGSHHWASTWHFGLVIYDEGLLDWLGVNRSWSCRESTIQSIFQRYTRDRIAMSPIVGYAGSKSVRYLLHHSSSDTATLLKLARRIGNSKSYRPSRREMRAIRQERQRMVPLQ